jgi:hypothetical protein
VEAAVDDDEEDGGSVRIRLGADSDDFYYVACNVLYTYGVGDSSQQRFLKRL